MTGRPPPAAERAKRRRPGRPKGGQVVADREQLLTAAMRVIDAHGPEVTLEDIAAGASVSKPILYRTIGDKDALIAALSETLVDRINASVAAATAAAPDPAAGFEAAIRASLHTIQADKHLFLFVNGGAGSESFRRLVDRSALDMIELFGASRARAGLDPTPARTWAYAVVGAIQVVATMWVRDEFADLDDVGRDLARLIWSGLAQVGDTPAET
ncbi:MAG: TetR/AcrR family transcriptional regulator [Ilumatobacteraceae bacterium]